MFKKYNWRGGGIKKDKEVKKVINILKVSRPGDEPRIF